MCFSKKPEKELRKKIAGLKEELADLKLQKSIDTREIEHLVKCKEEKNKIELERQEVALQKKYQEKELKLTNDFHKNSLELIEQGKKELNQIHQEIMKRLPDFKMFVKHTTKTNE